MKAHKYAEMFPMMTDSELRELADDIREHGQRQPIWKTKDGQILDGRNRLRACELAGVQPDIKVFNGDDKEALQFVASLNLTRRHLNESQRATIAAEIANISQGKPRRGKQADLPVSESGALSQAEAAKLLNTSERQVRKAQRVKRLASPETFAKVKAGKLSLNAAEQSIAGPRKAKAKKPKPKVAEDKAESASSVAPSPGAPALPKVPTASSAVTSSSVPGPVAGDIVVGAGDADDDLLDKITGKAQDLLDDLSQRVPASCRGQWYGFLTRYAALQGGPAK